MRVTSGRLRGRPLAAPIGLAVRPTSDKLRQAMFNILEHGELIPGFGLDGARVIDLFAGTGALAIEALSRGARTALLIDNNATSRALIRRNVEALGLTGATKIWRRDATNLGAMGPGEAFNLAFLDPPYRKELIVPALVALRDGGWLKSGAVVVTETAADEELAPPDGFTLCDERLYGDTRVMFLAQASHGNS